MAAILIKALLLLAIALPSLATLISGEVRVKSLEEQQQDLLNANVALNGNHDQVVQRLYWNQKARANKLQSLGEQVTADVVKTISQLSVIAESIRMFTMKKSIETAFKITAAKLKSGASGETELMKNELLVKRCEVRGIADAIRFSRSSLNAFHKLVSFYVVERKSPDVNVDALQDIVIDTYQRVQAIQSALYRAYREQQRLVTGLTISMGLGTNQIAVDHFLDSVDKEIDDGSGCLSCSKLYPADAELLNTTPMSVEYELRKFLDEGLDKSLHDSFEHSQHVVEFTGQDLDSVTGEEFENLMLAALGQEGLM